MSEEILKALMQLFAIITKQDDGVTDPEKEYVISFLKSQLNEEQVKVYYKQYEDYLEGKDNKREERKKRRAAEDKGEEPSLEELKKDPILQRPDEELSEEELKAKNKLARKIRRLEAKAKDLGGASEEPSLEDLKKDPILQRPDEELSEEELKSKNKLARKIRRLEAKAKDQGPSASEVNDNKPIPISGEGHDDFRKEYEELKNHPLLKEMPRNLDDEAKKERAKLQRRLRLLQHKIEDFQNEISVSDTNKEEIVEEPSSAIEQDLTPEVSVDENEGVVEESAKEELVEEPIQEVKQESIEEASVEGNKEVVEESSKEELVEEPIQEVQQESIEETSVEENKEVVEEKPKASAKPEPVVDVQKVVAENNGGNETEAFKAELAELESDPLLSQADDTLSEADQRAKAKVERKIRRLKKKIDSGGEKEQTLDEMKAEPILQKHDEECSDDELKQKNRLARKIRRLEAKAKDEASMPQPDQSPDLIRYKTVKDIIESTNTILKVAKEELSPEQLELRKVVEDRIAFYNQKIKEEEQKAKAEEEKATEKAAPTENLTSMKDSVRTLSLCKKINKTLSQPQKVVVLVRLFELLKVENNFSPARIMIIDTISEVFNFDEEEFKAIQSFVVSEQISDCNSPNIIVVNNEETLKEEQCKHIQTHHLNGAMLILKVNSVDLYFMRYMGSDELNFNGLITDQKRIYLFAPGSTIRLPKDKPVYYSDVVSRFLSDTNISKVSVDVDDLSFQFPNGNIGLRHVDMSEEHGKLVGIMGASGAGKTTLLNVLCGIEAPSQGSVKINGINIHENPELVEGVIGYIPQDDLLLEDLTVYQNLFYNAKLCFNDKSDQEIDDLVIKTLNNLGLLATKDLKVGNPLQKTISGGQRKRLNIGLELIREPSVLFVDEPTSGLSSRDSENVMDLLRELTLKGKAIFVVIHQPSSDIYKMFDKIFILDTGGYPIYYGNPVEAVTYFKKIDNQVNADQGECITCGNVDVELIFNIIEANVVDEYGRFTGERKVLPEKWSEYYNEKVQIEKVEEQTEKPEGSLDLPSKVKQWFIFTTRDVLSKLANRQYLTINLLEAPLLAFILAFIIRYVDNDGGAYVFGKNENIPAFIFICIIVALFMGLTVSAEEIVKDRKILKRESFLNLSKGSYFFSKMGILFTVSAIQTFSFTFIGNMVLGIDGMLFETWMVLFTVSCFANMLGLNISATFNSAITIYILIPILLIPQMVLSGAIFSFEKLHEWIGSDDDVPVIADMMVSRWAFEALAVNQFKDNEYEEFFYGLEKKESKADYKQVYYIPELQSRLEQCMDYIVVENREEREKVQESLSILKEGVEEFDDYFDTDFEYVDELEFDKALYWHFDSLKAHTSKKFNQIKDTETRVIMKKILRNVNKCQENILFESEDDRERLSKNLDLLVLEVAKENRDIKIHEFTKFDQLNLDSLTWETINVLDAYFKEVLKKYGKDFADANSRLNERKLFFQEGEESKKRYRRFRVNNHNDELAGLVKKSLSKNRIKEKNGKLIQVVDPIYRDPSDEKFFLNYRAHFYAPKKRFLGMEFDTFWFNLLVIWFMSLSLYLTLFYGSFKWLLDQLEILGGKMVVMIEPQINLVKTKVEEIKRKILINVFSKSDKSESNED